MSLYELPLYQPPKCRISPIICVRKEASPRDQYQVKARIQNTSFNNQFLLLSLSSSSYLLLNQKFLSLLSYTAAFRQSMRTVTLASLATERSKPQAARNQQSSKDYHPSSFQTRAKRYRLTPNPHAASAATTMDANDIGSDWIKVPDITINGIEDMFRPTLEGVALGRSPSLCLEQESSEGQRSPKVQSISLEPASGVPSGTSSPRLNGSHIGTEPFPLLEDEGFDEKMQLWLQQWTKPSQESLDTYRTPSAQCIAAEESTCMSAETTILTKHTRIAPDTWKTSHSLKEPLTKDNALPKEDKELGSRTERKPSQSRIAPDTWKTSHSSKEPLVEDIAAGAGRKVGLTEWKSSYPPGMPFVDTPQHKMERILSSLDTTKKLRTVRPKRHIGTRITRAANIICDFRKGKSSASKSYRAGPHQMLRIAKRPDAVPGAVLECIPQGSNGHTVEQMNRGINNGSVDDMSSGHWSTGLGHLELYHKDRHQKVHPKVLAKWEMEKEEADARGKASTDTGSSPGAERIMASVKPTDEDGCELVQRTSSSFGRTSNAENRRDLQASLESVIIDWENKSQKDLPTSSTIAANEKKEVVDISILSLRGGGSDDDVYVDAPQEPDGEEDWFSIVDASECTVDTSTTAGSSLGKDIGIVEKSISAGAATQREQNEAWERFVPESSANVRVLEACWRRKETAKNTDKTYDSSQSKDLSLKPHKAGGVSLWRPQVSSKKYIPVPSSTAKARSKKSKAESLMEPTTPVRSSWRRDDDTPQRSEGPASDGNENQWQVVVRSSDKKRGKKSSEKKSTPSPVSTKSSSTTSHHPRGRKSRLYEQNSPPKSGFLSSRRSQETDELESPDLAPSQALLIKHGYGPVHNRPVEGEGFVSWLASADDSTNGGNQNSNGDVFSYHGHPSEREDGNVNSNSKRLQHKTFASVVAGPSLREIQSPQELDMRLPIPFPSLGGLTSELQRSPSTSIFGDVKKTTKVTHRDEEVFSCKHEEAGAKLPDVETHNCIDTSSVNEGETSTTKGGSLPKSHKLHSEETWAMRAAKHAPKRMPLPMAWQKKDECDNEKLPDIESTLQEREKKTMEPENHTVTEEQAKDAKPLRRRKSTISQGPNLHTEKRAAQRELKRAKSPEKKDIAPKTYHKKSTSLGIVKKPSLERSCTDTKKPAELGNPIRPDPDWQIVVTRKTGSNKVVENVKDNAQLKSPIKSDGKRIDSKSVKPKGLDSFTASKEEGVSPLRIPSAMYEPCTQRKSPINGPVTYASVTSGRLSASLLEQGAATGPSDFVEIQEKSINSIDLVPSDDSDNHASTGDPVEDSKTKLEKPEKPENTEENLDNQAQKVPQTTANTGNEGEAPTRMTDDVSRETKHTETTLMTAFEGKEISQTLTVDEEHTQDWPQTPRRSRRLARLDMEFRPKEDDIQLPEDELVPILHNGDLLGLGQTPKLLRQSQEKKQKRAASNMNVPPPKMALDLSKEVNIKERFVRKSNPLVGNAESSKESSGIKVGQSHNVSALHGRRESPMSEKARGKLVSRGQDSRQPSYRSNVSQMSENNRPFEFAGHSRLNPLASEFSYGPNDMTRGLESHNYLQGYPVKDEIDLNTSLLRQPHRYGHPDMPITYEKIAALEQSVLQLKSEVSDTFRLQYQHYRSGLVAENPYLYYQPAQLNLMFAPPLERPPIHPMSSYKERWENVQSTSTPEMALGNGPPVQMQIKMMDNINKMPDSEFYGVKYHRRKAVSDTRLYGQSTFQYLTFLPAEGPQVANTSEDVWEGLNPSIRTAVDEMHHPFDYERLGAVDVDARTRDSRYSQHSFQNNQSQAVSHGRLRSLSGDRPRGFPNNEPWQYHEQISMAERHAEHKPPQYSESTTLDKFERLRLAYGMRHDGRVTHRILERTTPFEKTTLGKFLERGAPVDFQWKRRERAKSGPERLTRLRDSATPEKVNQSTAAPQESPKRTRFSSTPLGSILNDIEGADEVVVPNIFYSSKENDAEELNIPFWTQLQEMKIAREVLARFRGKDHLGVMAEARRRASSDSLVEHQPYSRDCQMLREQ